MVMVQLRLGIPTKQASSDTPSGASGRKPPRGAVRKITSQNMAKKPSFCPRNLTKNLETMHHVPKVEWVLILSSPLSTVSTSRMVAFLEGLGNCHCACLAGRAAATTMWHLRNHASPQRPNIPQRRRFTGMFHLLQVMLKDSIESSRGSVL